MLNKVGSWLLITTISGLILTLVFSPYTREVISLFAVCPAPFDAGVWKNAEDLETRRHMLLDLISRHKLVGLSRRGLVDLLGLPVELGQPLPQVQPYGGGYERWRYPIASDQECLLVELQNGMVSGFQFEFRGKKGL